MSEHPKLPPTFYLGDLIADFVADTDAAAKARETGRPRGAITGLTKLDQFFGGYLAPGIHVLQSAPGAGKTALALQTASDCVYPALYVSAEMGLLELFRRLIARQTQTFLGKLKTGEISGDRAKALAASAVQKLDHLRIMDATKAFASPEIIIRAAEGLRERFETDQVLIILDSLHVWARSVGMAESGLVEADEYTLVNQALGGVGSVASALNCPVITISHRNREGNKSKGGDKLHAAKGSGSIEYEAESVLDLSKESETNANGEKEIKAAFQKNRNGDVGFVSLMFHGALQTFREL